MLVLHKSCLGDHEGGLTPRQDNWASQTFLECANLLQQLSYTPAASCGFWFRSWIRAACKYTCFASLWLAARPNTASAACSVPKVHSRFMYATHTLKRSLASAKPTCFTARSATCRARS